MEEKSTATVTLPTAMYVFQSVASALTLKLIIWAEQTTGNHSRLTKHHQDPIYPSPNAPGQTSAADELRTGYGTGPTTDNNMTGVGSYGGRTAAGHGGRTDNDVGQGGAAAYPMAPRTDASGNPVHPGSTGHGGGGSRMIGKVETAVGTAVGSQSLRQSGLAKEQEANALKAQASEIGEAERLEREALTRRERAVAHGAHPDHGHVGGRNPGAGAANVDELGGGAGYGATGAGGAGSAARGGY